MGVAKYHKDEKDAIKEVIYQSGIHVKPVYGPKDLEEIGFDYQSDLGDPGEYPFTRSLHPQGYRSRAWTTRQYTGFGTPEETNKRFKYMISHGQTGLNVGIFTNINRIVKVYEFILPHLTIYGKGCS